MKVITDLKDLKGYFLQDPKLAERIREAQEAINSGHKFMVTEFYLTKVIKVNPKHPLIAMFLPSMDDLDVEQGLHTSTDETRISDSEYMIQKYRPNSILTLTTKCAQICTYCFRKQHKDRLASVEEIDRILEDIENTGRDYIEVVFSGGDPLMMPPHLFEHLAKRLESLRERRSLLIGLNTRLPIVAPSMCYGTRLDTLHRIRPNNIGLHIMHPDEITEEFRDVCHAIRRKSMPNLKTTHPLLKGINDDPELLTDMYRQLAEELNVSPKDLIVPIPQGAGKSKRLSLERCMEIMRELHYRLPGNLLPRLIACSPVYGKSYIDPFHTKADGSFGYDKDAQGRYIGMYIKDGSKLQRCKAIE